jgi:hypothetical protein
MAPLPVMGRGSDSLGVIFLSLQKMRRHMDNGKHLICPSCEKNIPIQGIYHAGFNDEGFLYCNRDLTVLTFSIYDETFIKLAPDRTPWPKDAIAPLNKEEQGSIERQLKSCPCGGTFSFRNQPRCLYCHASLASLVDSIHYVIFNRRISGEKEQIWKTQ